MRGINCTFSGTCIEGKNICLLISHKFIVTDKQGFPVPQMISIGKCKQKYSYKKTLGYKKQIILEDFFCKLGGKVICNSVQENCPGDLILLIKVLTIGASVSVPQNK